MDKNERVPDDAPAPALRSADVLLWGALPHLQLNIAQTADLCGISVRQLGYWTKQGYVAAAGHGARRMYGLDSLRHVLAIRNAMSNGMSLRQALKALPGIVASNAAPSPLQEVAYATPQETRPIPTTQSAQERDALVADLLGLFAANPHTRDDASGLAVKVGRSTVDIWSIADKLCSRGILTKTVSQGSVVFENAAKEHL